ncbi:outer membrane protein transport protein [Desulfobulbus sp.]|uniref:OmpP1/FadL family transporter n=1 Tax=Desulfobulbus sp. TaxID=895 RepID=UPI00286F6327|nr:outer membrane protein transport protein [Desulfobulbus sp.]
MKLDGRKVFFFVVGLLLAPIVLTQQADASGFRIANQSLGAIGLSGARTAYTPGPDASYYNPANMSFLPDHWLMETSLTILQLPTVEYTDHRSPMFNGSSDEELFWMPLLHVTSPQYGRMRYGFSLTYPFGLAKQWDQPYPKAFAEKFSLLTVEANPTVACSITDWLSIGGGVRLIYAKGEVDNEIGAPLSPMATLSRASDGTDTQLGYNLAVSIRPNERWTMAATYRSEVKLDLDGHTDMQAMAGPYSVATYSGDGSVSLNLPAVLSLATALSFDRLTVELAWDRTYWSSFRELDFSYPMNFLNSPFAPFDAVSVKNWDDSDAYRIGLTYDWNDRWTTTLGFTYDRTPVPAHTLGYELPDADAMVYCAGARYRYSPSTEFGLSYMYYRTRSRSVDAADANLSGIDGRFTDGGAHALTFGVIMSF